MWDSECKFPSEGQAPVWGDKWEEEAQDINGFSTYPENAKLEIWAVQARRG